MPFVVRKLRGVSHDVGKQCRRLLRSIERITPIRHRVGVMLVPNIAVECPDGSLCHGCLFWRRMKNVRWIDGCGCMIFVGANLDALDRLTPAERLETIQQTIAHEVAHYEQFRDGRELQERGVEVRAKNLIAKVLSRRPARKLSCHG